MPGWMSTRIIEKMGMDGLSFDAAEKAVMDEEQSKGDALYDEYKDNKLLQSDKKG